ncbi:MAG TPA: hypothetical protein VGD78_11345 [Chthoniobacterales bacterium]
MASISVCALEWAALSIVAIGFQMSAYGQLGETLPQCETRYGHKISEHNGSAGFRKDGYYIFVRFFEGRADAILFSKARSDTLDRPEPISNEEIRSLLDGCSNGQPWSTSRAVATGLRWSAGDGALLADYGTLDRCLVILTKDHVEREVGRAAARPVNRLQGG